MAKGKGPMIPGNMNNMMKQIQKMQKEMQETQSEIEEQEFEASAGGGAIRAVVNGRKELVAIDLKPEIVDPDDIEMLEDLIIAAVNEALKNADETMSKSMGKFTAGMNVPGLF
ncbi:YbaB/EbfC family nucleoid-associated protein [Fusibacter tunisiensis]|uniref:Nucleoid-associated protein JOC49_000498 n=1 Tax=Fusibacter tunisiensis TaxID=1008308 RepID=A0ABS2MNK3_9FIRM|nr:YbaB/EbfC family nucleoid-associated protein [Fusibacter tunisiensis]MBM7560984.1 DNA-binding YbaB/EbfC family protein [Fusibacter tunisiensis]